MLKQQLCSKCQDILQDMHYVRDQSVSDMKILASASRVSPYVVEICASRDPPKSRQCDS